MSHASCLVALSPENITGASGSIERAVEFQMYPFNENGEWFKDSSRWDWYEIGGRYTGRLTGYDPESDPENWKTCHLCHGAGKRFDMVVANGCNGCSGTGTAREFHNRKVDGADIVKRVDLDIAALHKQSRKAFEKNYAKAASKSADSDRQWIKMLHNVDPLEENLDAYLTRVCKTADQSVVHYAFLRNRHWNEPERLGWFGSTTATECEIQAKETSIKAATGRCLHKDEKTSARVIVWNESWEAWSKEFYRRFVEDLSPDTVLVTVDYHV